MYLIAAHTAGNTELTFAKQRRHSVDERFTVTVMSCPSVLARSCRFRPMNVCFAMELESNASQF